MLLVISTAYCEQSATAAESTQTLVSPKPVTDEEAKKFACNLEQAFVDEDHKAFWRLINMQAILEEATSNLGFSPEHRKRVIKDYLKKITGENGESQFLTMLLGDENDQATYRLLRIYDKKEQTHVVFRSTRSTILNFDYHDLTLSNGPEGICAVQIYSHTTGEQFSAMLRRSLLPQALEINRKVLLKQLAPESEYLKHFDKYVSMVRQGSEEDYEGVLKIYNSLPASLQKAKTMLKIRYKSASHISEKEKVKALQDFHRYYPKDICLAFLLIDEQVLDEEFHDAVKRIDLIDQAVGGDGYLDFWRGNILFEAGKNVEALEKMEQAIATAPDIIDGYWGKLDIYLGIKDHILTLHVMNHLEVKFDVSWNDLRDVPKCKEFIASDLGKQWLFDHGYATDKTQEK